MPFIQARDGAQLHVRVVGRGQPVLLLPGLGMSSRHWLPYVLPFVHRFRFHLPDFRGHGRSRRARLNQPDVFRNHMEDTQDIIRAFGLTEFLLGGISLGCSTALHLRKEAGWQGVRAYLHIDQSPCVRNSDDWPFGLVGERQESLIEEMTAALEILGDDTRYRFYDQLPMAQKQRLAKRLAAIFDELGSGMKTRLMMARLPHLPGFLVRRTPLMRLEDMRAYLLAYSGPAHDYRPALDRDEVPVTVLIGSRSPLYAAEGQALIAQRAARGRVVHFTRSGHAPMLDEPVKFLRELARFLADHAETGAVPYRLESAS